MTYRILLAGGGTGGHVFPMLAVAEALRERTAGDVELTFIGTAKGIETRVVPAAGERLELLDVAPLRGGGPVGLAKGLFRAVGVLPTALRLVDRLRPDVVFSVGGYAAGPVTLAARIRRIPVTLLEPNSVMGFTNRLLRPLVCRGYVCFPETEASFSPSVGRWTGVPLRGAFTPSPPPENEVPRVLVMGGSQGALALNETLPRAFRRCHDRGLEFTIRHQAGRDKDDATRALYRELGLEAHVTPFIDDVAGALAEADLVVERAGAGSLAELCAVGRPGVLIPYPYAADDHQLHNAESLAKGGAARCVVQGEATDERLAEVISDLLEDRGRLAKMAGRAAERGRPDAARVVAEDLLSLAAETRRRKGPHPIEEGPRAARRQMLAPVKGREEGWSR
ncbi:MAG: undecaprenyldiphospho-muramoylpentapeptide beta-N-acetylglucosaminyltransferase [Myxococcota bacterium]